MGDLPLEIPSAEREFYGGRLLLKDYIRHPKPNRYRSYHMVFSLPLRFLEKTTEYLLWLEVQLRTIAMDCWAGIEPPLKYKHRIENQPFIVQELKRCTDKIASTDLSLQTLRDFIEASGKEEALCEF